MSSPVSFRSRNLPLHLRARFPKNTTTTTTTNEFACFFQVQKFATGCKRIQIQQQQQQQQNNKNEFTCFFQVHKRAVACCLLGTRVGAVEHGLAQHGSRDLHLVCTGVKDVQNHGKGHEVTMLLLPTLEYL